VRRTQCSSCGYDDLHQFLDLGLSPIADAYTDNHVLDVPHFPLQLAVCRGCHLVQLLEVVSTEILFGTGYSFYSSASQPLSDYHAEYAQDVIDEWWKRQGIYNPAIMEIGCNDGDMLRHFKSAGWNATGVDPAGGPVSKARQRGLRVLQMPFTFEVAYNNISERVDVVLANHVLAHVEDVSTVIAGMQVALALNGVAYVEVQYLPDLLLNNAFDLVYHEHRNFFSLTSLEHALQSHGLYVNEAWLTERQGGSLRVRVSRKRESSDRVDKIRNSEAWLSDLKAYEGLQGRAERIRDRLLQLLESNKSGVIAGYGAPAKATTLLNFCGIGAEHLAFVQDTTAAKWNRYIPGTGVKIYAPSAVEEQRVDTYLLLAWNYASTILRREYAFTSEGGRWIIPIPVPILI
jgi:hypothetical protein